MSDMIDPADPAVLTGIAQLVTNCIDPMDPAAPMTPVGDLGLIEDAALVVGDGRIIWAGERVKLPEEYRTGVRHIDLGGRTVIPGFVDSHSHLAFAGDRGDEFESRMDGLKYDGGGILRTVDATRAASEDELRTNLRRLMAEARSQGTTTMEIKSGYGLDIPNETKLLRVAAEFTEETTFLGGHAVPEEYRGSGGLGDRDEYVRLVCGPMLDAVVADGHAKWSDVFCEPHSPYAFDGDETRAMLSAAKRRGLALRVHGSQLGPGPGPRIACEFGAASVDHCTFLTGDDLDALAGTWPSDLSGGFVVAGGPGSSGTTALGTVATFLPAVEFSTKQPYPDMRRAIDAGIPVAIASDCNPGTCFSDSMPFAVAIAVREMGLTVPQAIWAATAGGALALRRGDVGVIRRDAKADLAVVDAPSYAHIVYRPGVPLTKTLDPKASQPA